MKRITCKNIVPQNWQNAWLALTPNQAHVWRLALDQTDDKSMAKCWELLSSAERQRAQKFRKAEDWLRFIAGRFLLKLLLAKYTDRSLHEIDIEAAKGGKPLMKNGSGALQFNLSHAGQMVMLAFQYHQPIGIDVEPVNADPLLEDIVKDYFSPQEKDQLKQASATQRFFTFWTRKEAVLKAVGVGLVDGLSELDTADGEHLLEGSGQAVQVLEAPVYYVYSFEPAAGYLASVSVAGEATGLAFFDGAKLVQTFDR